MPRLSILRQFMQEAHVRPGTCLYGVEERVGTVTSPHITSRLSQPISLRLSSQGQLGCGLNTASRHPSCELRTSDAINSKRPPSCDRVLYFSTSGVQEALGYTLRDL